MSGQTVVERILGTAASIRVKLCLSKPYSSAKLYQALYFNYDDEHKVLFDFDMACTINEHDEITLIALDKTIRLEASLKKDKGDSPQERCNLRLDSVLVDTAADFLTATLTVIGIPYHWSLIQVAPQSSYRQPLHLTQQSLLENGWTMSHLARELRKVDSQEVWLAIAIPEEAIESRAAIAMMGTELHLAKHEQGAYGKKRGPADQGLLTKTQQEKAIALKQEVFVAPKACEVTFDDWPDKAHLVDLKYRSHFGSLILAIEMAFINSRSEHCQHVLSSLAVLHSPGTNLPNLLSTNDIIGLNPQVHRFFDDHQWFLNPLGRGSWTWVSTKRAVPLSMKYLLQGGSRSNRGIEEHLARTSKLAAPMMASVCKIVLHELATDDLRRSFRKAAASKPGERSSPRTSTIASSEASKSRSRLSSGHDDSFDPWSDPFGGPSSTSEDHHQEQGEGASNVGQTTRGHAGAIQASSSTRAESEFEIPTSSTRVDSDLIEPKEAEEDLADKEQQELDRHVFNEWWIHNGGKLGTTAERRAAVIIQSVATLATSSPSQQLDSPLGSLARVREFLDLDMLSGNELERVGTSGEELEKALGEIVGGEEGYQNLVDDQTSAAFYAGYLTIVGRVRGQM